MNLTIRSKKLNKVFEFWAPSNGGYVRLIDKDHPGTMGQQICEGGCYSGSTISASNEISFKHQCRSWCKSMMRAQ